jgi:hypothetical protein
MTEQPPPFRPYPPGQAWDEAWHQRLRAEQYRDALRQVVEAYTEFRYMTSFDLAYKLKELAEKGLGEE